MEISPDQLFAKACRNLGFDPVAIVKELDEDTSQRHLTTIIKHVFNLIENPEQHAILAGAIAMRSLYKEAPLTLKGYLDLFGSLLRDDVLDFYRAHINELQSAVLYEKDFEFNYFAIGTLLDTYLARLNYDLPPMEIPQFCYLRIAVGEFCADGVEAVLKYYRHLATQECTAASPTIFNMGFKEGAPSSCMIYAVGDSLVDILKVVKEAGMASKNNAGIGMDFSGLRHSSIGRHGMSKGIIPLLKTWDDLTIYINQGGRRPGAMTASTRVHHYDTPEFIELVDKTGEDHNKVTKIKTSIMLSDLFLKRCAEGGMWTLFCPKQTGRLNLLHGAEFEKEYFKYEEKARLWRRYQKYLDLKRTEETRQRATQEKKRMGQVADRFQTYYDLDGSEVKVDLLETQRTVLQPSSELYDELRQEFEGNPKPEQIDSREMPADEIMTNICKMELRTGTPYIVHGCNTNRKNNMCNVGPVRSLNLCQEITIPAIPGEQTGCCNLASLSLKKFVRGSEFDYLRFADVVKENVRALNRVIDVTRNVSKKVIKSNQMNRPIGIGVSGFAEMCYLMDLTVTEVPEAPFYTEEALKERVVNPKLADLNWRIWSCMLYNAYLASVEEAKRRGPYPNFPTSPTAQGRLQYHLWQEEEKVTGRQYPFKLEPAEPKEWGQSGSWSWLQGQIKEHGLANALLLTCMPTASTAQVLGNTESTEFPMNNIMTRRVQSGDYPVLNFHMVKDLQEIGMWSKEIYAQIIAANGSILGLSEEGLSPEFKSRLRHLKEKYLMMWEIPQMIMIGLAAQRQVFIDQSQSFNVYIANPTIELLKRLHIYTNEMGLKTGMYYLHTRAPNQSLKLNGSNASLKSSAVDTVAKELLEVCKIGPAGECIGCQ